MIQITVKVGDAVKTLETVKDNAKNTPTKLLTKARKFALDMTNGYNKKTSTGAMRQAIIPVNFKDGKKAILRLRLPSHPDNRARPYHMWHHGRGKQLTSYYLPKIARPDFMDYAAEKTVEWAQKQLGNELIKGT